MQLDGCAQGQPALPLRRMAGVGLLLSNPAGFQAFSICHLIFDGKCPRQQAEAGVPRKRRALCADAALRGRAHMRHIEYSYAAAALALMSGHFLTQNGQPNPTAAACAFGKDATRSNAVTSWVERLTEHASTLANAESSAE